ncbi:MAG: helix-turn-helix domain-containing protein [Desulfobacteraceae bacterium]|nr:helix-turn-helix domain-containing protein [Desulfobacteraceae bacterium]
MHHPWSSLISVLSEITRKSSCSVVCCTHCGNRHTYVKWGFYRRYLFNDEPVNIQRYRCDNVLCPRKTFSILPHAFLPITRASLCMLMYILKMYKKGRTIAAIARHTGSKWQKIQRWVARASTIKKWFEQEYVDTSPCLGPGRQWASFTRDFSWAFYPDQEE